MEFSVLYFMQQSIRKNSMRILNRVLKEQRVGKDFFCKLNYPFKPKSPMVWPLTPLHYRCTLNSSEMPLSVNFIAEAACGWEGASVDPRLLLEEALWPQN